MLQASQPLPKTTFDSDTEDSEIRAPKHRPMESQQYPPQFMLQDCQDSQKLDFHFPARQPNAIFAQRKLSLDLSLSILGFINRKLNEQMRFRIMSEEISHGMR